ncbi:hypothetical protein Tco_1419623 [Tanacetum coccineum]
MHTHSLLHQYRLLSTSPPTIGNYKSLSNLPDFSSGLFDSTIESQHYKKKFVDLMKGLTPLISSRQEQRKSKRSAASYYTREVSTSLHLVIEKLVKESRDEEPVFEVAASDMPQDQEGNLGDNKDEIMNETSFRRDWFKKPTPPQEPTDPD